MSTIKDRAKIIPDTRFELTLYLVDEDGRPVSLSPYVSGKLVFMSAAGVRTAIDLAVPGVNPDKGQLEISAVATGADGKWASADLELYDSANALTVIPLTNKFEILKRNCPAA